MSLYPKKVECSFKDSISFCDIDIGDKNYEISMLLTSSSHPTSYYILVTIPSYPTCS